MFVFDWFKSDNESKKENEMGRLVKFNVKDGKKPARVGQSKTFAIRAPFDIRIKAELEVNIDMGFSCTYPIIVFPSLSVTRAGVSLAAVTVFEEGESVFLHLKNTNKQDLTFGEGEILARFYVMDNRNFEVEE